MERGSLPRSVGRPCQGATLSEREGFLLSPRGQVRHQKDNVVFPSPLSQGKGMFLDQSGLFSGFARPSIPAIQKAIPKGSIWATISRPPLGALTAMVGG